MNFGTGLLQFIDFYQDIHGGINQLLVWIQARQKLFRSFEGWKTLWLDEEVRI